MKKRMCGILAGVLLCLAAGVRAEELRPSWECLPAETVAALRVPGGRAFIQELRTRTKWGAVFFSEDRLRKLEQIIREESGVQGAKTTDELAHLGLKPEDVSHLCDGEAGVALIVEPRGERGQLLVAVGWCQPGADIAQRLAHAASIAVEDQAKEKFPPKRTDVDLAGKTVMLLTFPETGLPPSQMMRPSGGMPGSGGMGTDGAGRLQQAPPAPPAPGLEVKPEPAPEPRLVAEHYVLMAQLGDRLLVMVTQSIGPDASAAGSADGKVDWDSVSGLEEAKGLMARFIEAHGKNGGPFADRVQSSASTHQYLPEGKVALEGFIDFGKPFMAALTADKKSTAPEMMKSLGLDTLGLAGCRWALQGQAVRSGMFLEWPAPRHGLASLLDQAPLDTRPPAWVPADVTQFTQISFDLGKAYTLVRDLVTQTAGPEQAGTFHMVEGQCQAMLQVDVATLLSAFGHQHNVLTYPPETVKMPAPVQGPGQGADQGAGPKMVEVPSQRFAIDWRVKDEAVIQKLMKALSMIAAQSGGAMKEAQEQGFSGWRLEKPPMEGGLMLGNGHLVMAEGKGVLEKVLAAISTPPQGEAALCNSASFKRSNELMPFKPAVMNQVMNTQSYISDTRQMLDALKGPLAAQETGPQMRIMKRLLELWPTDDEMRGVFGASASQTVVDDHGVALQGLLEMPAAGAP